MSAVDSDAGASPEGGAHPGSEAAFLARAAAAHLRRATRRGRRRAPAPQALVPVAPCAPAPPAAERPAPVRSAPPPQPAAARAAPLPPPAADDTPRVRAAACADLAALRSGVEACTACELARTRTRTVFGSGEPRALVMFVGEAPGADEDASGLPFVGRAGALLTDIITKGMGLAREEVFIANVLKCRPPGNRDPLPHEKELCTGWLERQIELVDPRVLIPLGAHAAGHLLGTQAPISRLRGQVHERGGRKIVPTYHPAYLLRSPEAKPDCWKDIQLAMAELGLPVPGGGNRSGSSG